MTSEVAGGGGHTGDEERRGPVRSLAHPADPRRAGTAPVVARVVSAAGILVVAGQPHPAGLLGVVVLHWSFLPGGSPGCPAPPGCAGADVMAVSGRCEPFTWISPR